MTAQVYTTSGVVGAFPNPVTFARNPTTSDKVSPNGNPYPIWQQWFNSANGSFWAYAGGGSWVTLGGGSSDVNTINNLSPTAGNITIAGTANQITMTSAGSTVTASVPAAFTAPGSITATTSVSSTTTMTAGTGLTATTGNIVATAGNVTAGAAVSATTTVTAGTGITSTTGNIVATAGNVTAGAAVSATTTVTAGTDLIATNGNLLIQGAAKQIRIEGGAVTDFIGQATLVAGTVTVANTNIAAADKIFVQRQGINGSTALGVFDVAITPATSFSITARNPTDATTQTNDTSIVDYVIIRQL